jgi:hypothetical protein
MGLLAAIRNTEVSLWIEALDRHLRERLETVNAPSEVAEAMINRLNPCNGRFNSDCPRGSGEANRRLS